MKKLTISCKGWFLLPGYIMNVFGTIYCRPECCGFSISDKVINHEGIHLCQVEDISKVLHIPMWLAYIIFYILYFIEWIFKVIISIFTLFKVKAYSSISFEQEAYNNDFNFKYQDTRKRGKWLKYIFKLVWKN